MFLAKNGNGACGLYLPKTNLYNGSNNKKFYYEKLADQLIRYEKIENIYLLLEHFYHFNVLITK